MNAHSPGKGRRFSGNESHQFSSLPAADENDEEFGLNDAPDG